jgi:PKHD-type hydroxylase
LKAWWRLFPNAFAADVCDNIIRDALVLPPVEATIGHGGSSHVDKEFRTSTLRWIPRTWKSVRSELRWYVDTANTETFGFDLWTLRDVQFTAYEATNAGHYNFHEDLSWVSELNFHRKLSIVVNLSHPTDYDGGLLEFGKEQPDPVKLRGRGSVIVFPSFLRHRVTAVTKGIRHSLVSWVEGPKFR